MKYSLVLLTIALTTSANSFMALTPSFARKKSKKPLSFTSSSLNAGGVTSQPSSGDSFSDENQRVEEPFLVASNPKLEAAWRFVKKPLLRIGGKGIAKSHANSLCELLLAHTVVKVKINTTKLGSWTDVFDTLKQSTQETGKIEGLEMIHYRPSENMLMVGRKGALKMIENGEFPPPPPQSDEE